MRPFLSVDDKVFPANQLAASLLDLAAARGASREKLLRGTGIFIEDVKTAKALSADQLLRLIERANKLVPANDCAFQLGRRLFPGSYGKVSEALMHCRNLTDALRILSRLRNQICPFVSASIRLEDECVYLLINDAIGCGSNWQFVTECYFTALVSAIKLLSGKRIPLHFDLPFARPRHIQEYEENLGFRLQFNQPILAIKFARSYLKIPFLQHSSAVKHCAIQQASGVHIAHIGFLDAIRQVLHRHPQTTLQQVAAHFAISPATFKRKLSQHGTSFQSIHDDIRKQQAVYLLKLKGLNNEATAYQMAFNDVPNFRRAVKRWTGLTPSALKSAQP